MKRMSIVALLLLALTAAPARAGTLNAVINGKSIHVDSTYEWNEANYGFGIEYEFADQSLWRPVVMANGFRDSNDEMSYFAGAGLHRRLLRTDSLGGAYLDAGLNVFVMTRRDVNDNKPFPGMLPSVTFGNRYVGFNVTYLPVSAVKNMLRVNMADPTVSGIYFLQFKVNVEQLLPGTN